MPPFAKTPSEDPSLEDLGMRTSRRALRDKQKVANDSANTVSTVPFQTNKIPFTEQPPTPTNDNELKAKQIAENPYLAKPTNGNYNPRVSKEVNDSNLDRTHIGQVEEARKKEQRDTTQTPLRKYASNNKEALNRTQALRGVADEESRQLTVKQKRQKLKKQILAIQNVFKEYKIDITTLEAKSLLRHGFKKSFPGAMFAMAVIKDLFIDPLVAAVSLSSAGVGVASTISVVGAGPGIGFLGLGVGIGIIGSIFSIILGMIRRWMSRLYFTSIFGRSKVVQKILRKQMVGDLASSLGDSIPIVNVLPLPLINLWRKIALVSKITRKCRAAVDAIK